MDQAQAPVLIQIQVIVPHQRKLPEKPQMLRKKPKYQKLLQKLLVNMLERLSFSSKDLHSRPLNTH